MYSRAIALLAFLLLACAPAHAQLVRSCPTASAENTSARDYGGCSGATWQVPTANAIVIAEGSPWTWKKLSTLASTARVLTCTAKPVGSTELCVVNGGFSDRFVTVASLNITSQPPPPPPPTTNPTIHFLVMPTGGVAPGTAISLQWNVTEVSSCNSSWAGSVPISGNASIPISQDTEFTLECTDGTNFISGNTTVTVAAPAPWQPHVARCYPTLTNMISLKMLVDAEGHEVYGWDCDDALGYTYNWRAFSIADLISRISCTQGLGSMTDEASTRAVDVKCQRPATPAENVAGAALAEKWRARFPVSAGSNRVVYTRNADGTRGPQLRIGNVNQTIAAGNLCDGGRRLTGTSTTRYNDCAGRTSVQGQVLPAHSYAQTTKTAAPAGGWP